MTCPDLSAKIYELMGWEKGYRYKMLGYKIQIGIEKLYIFDLTVSERFKEGTRSRKGEYPHNIAISEALEENTSILAHTSSVSLPEKISGSFGVSVAQHKKDTEIKNFDGYVTAAMITGSIDSKLQLHNENLD